LNRYNICINIRNEKFIIEKEYLEKLDKSIPTICENLLKQIRQKTSQTGILF